MGGRWVWGYMIEGKYMGKLLKVLVPCNREVIANQILSKRITSTTKFCFVKIYL